MIDMAMLIAANQPDADGNVIPSNIQEGSAQFESAKGHREKITVVVSGGLYNVADATCGNICTTCCGDNNFGINPGTFFVPFGGSFQCGVTTVDCNGLEAYPSSWSSSDTAVMTVDANGNVQGVSVGPATITAAYLPATVYTGQVCNTSCPTNNVTTQANGTVTPSLQLTVNQYSSLFVGTDPNLATPNSIFATVNPSGGTFTETSSNASDTFAPVQSGGPGWVVNTTTQSTNGGDRRITVTYTMNSQQTTKSLNVTARRFAYATNNSPSNTCTLGYGTKYLYTYTPYTHPDHAAVQAGIGLSNTPVTESFNPQPPAGAGTGNGNLDANSQFTDRIEYCSTAPLTLSATVTQTISIEGYQVRQNLLTYSSSGVSLTNQGPTQ
jgi:hypothetical protein